MTVGGSAHLAPDGAEGMEAIGFGVAGSKAMKAICVPSGDHARFPGGWVMLVTRAIWPVSIQRTQICVAPPSDERKASRVPSGDQRGETSLRGPVVRARWFLPSASTIQRFDWFLSVMTSENWRT